MELKSEKCGNFLTWETKSYLMVGVEDVLANAKVGSICILPFDILLAYLGFPSFCKNTSPAVLQKAERFGKTLRISVR